MLEAAAKVRVVPRVMLAGEQQPQGEPVGEDTQRDNFPMSVWGTQKKQVGKPFPMLLSLPQEE